MGQYNRPRTTILHLHITILLLLTKTVYQTRLISKTMARYYRNMMTTSESTLERN